jgi:hypothetical protein
MAFDLYSLNTITPESVVSCTLAPGIFDVAVLRVAEHAIRKTRKDIVAIFLITIIRAAYWFQNKARRGLSKNFPALSYCMQVIP